MKNSKGSPYLALVIPILLGIMLVLWCLSSLSSRPTPGHYVSTGEKVVCSRCRGKGRIALNPLRQWNPAARLFGCGKCNSTGKVDEVRFVPD